MLKTTCDLIRQVVSSRLQDEVEFYVRPSNTGGFWGLIIKFKSEPQLLAQIEEVAKAIGRFNGEIVLVQGIGGVSYIGNYAMEID